jgi:phosphoglycolate phosphatase
MALLNEVVFPHAVLFDWDNTLVDNWLTIQAALNAAQADAGTPLFSLEETKINGRHSARETFPRLFGDRWERALDIFYAQFSTQHLVGLRIMPGVGALLDVLGAARVPLAIISNKKGDLLRREVAHLGWSERFLSVIGGQDAPFDKPHPAPVHLALEGTGIAANPAVWVVGDTDIDIRAGLAAGCTAILVGPGPHDPALLVGAKPALRFADCDALAGFVRSIGSTISQES